jgi:hypothetical protein
MSSLTDFEQSALPNSDDYGWCYTDRLGKDATKIREQDNEPARADFFLSQEEGDFTKHFFDFFHLPVPHEKNIYRGNSQDLLFLNDCGLVVRTGPLDVVDLIHPGILQPLYWMPDDITGHVIALYPGVQLLKYNECGEVTDQSKIWNLFHFLGDTEQNSLDIHSKGNVGLIGDLPVVIDLENQMFGTMGDLKERKRQSYNMYLDAGLSPVNAIRQTMVEFYGGHPDFKKWIKAYDYHQPLRNQLHDALNMPNEEMRRNRMALFYQRCRKVTGQTEKLIEQKWSTVIRDRQKFWVKEEPREAELSLYKAWTGKEKDNEIKRIMSLKV